MNFQLGAYYLTNLEFVHYWADLDSYYLVAVAPIAVILAAVMLDVVFD